MNTRKVNYKICSFSGIKTQGNGKGEVEVYAFTPGDKRHKLVLQIEDSDVHSLIHLLRKYIANHEQAAEKRLTDFRTSLGYNGRYAKVEYSSVEPKPF